MFTILWTMAAASGNKGESIGRYATDAEMSKFDLIVTKVLRWFGMRV